MPLLTAECTPPQDPKNSAMLYINDVVGAAIFDLNGLPKEYFTTAENHSMGWLQTIFQALGLRSLLMSSLQLENFQYAVIEGSGYCAVIVKQRTSYSALLLKQKSEEISIEVIDWAQTFEPEVLRENPRFQAA